MKHDGIFIPHFIPLGPLKEYEATFDYDLLLGFVCTSCTLVANLNFLKADAFQFKFDCFVQKALDACKQVQFSS